MRCSVLDFLLFLLNNVSEDIVQYEVAVCLRGKDESLGEFAVGLRLVGDLSDDLDDDVGVRSLRIDVSDADLAVLEAKLLYPVIDGLRVSE